MAITKKPLSMIVKNTIFKAKSGQRFVLLTLQDVNIPVLLSKIDYLSLEVSGDSLKSVFSKVLKY